jgi:hypothetical protein
MHVRMTISQLNLSSMTLLGQTHWCDGSIWALLSLVRRHVLVIEVQYEESQRIEQEDKRLRPPGHLENSNQPVVCMHLASTPNDEELQDNSHI